MQLSKALLKKAGILPKLRLGKKLEKGGIKSLGPKRVIVLEDKIMRKPDPRTGKETEVVRYIVEENGEKKYYDTDLNDKYGKLSYFVQRMAEIKEGTEVILEMKRQGAINYIDITPIEEGHTSRVEVDEEIEEDEEAVRFDEIMSEEDEG